MNVQLLSGMAINIHERGACGWTRRRNDDHLNLIKIKRQLFGADEEVPTICMSLINYHLISC